MSVRQALLSILQLFVLFVFFSIGLFFLAIPKLPQFQTYLEHLLLQNREACFQLGLAFCLAGSILLIGFYSLNRGRYLSFRMGKNRTEIEVSLVYQTLEEFLKSRFSNEIQLVDVELIRSKIQIQISSKNSLQKESLLRIEKEIAPFLRQRFGYKQLFDLIVKI